MLDLFEESQSKTLLFTTSTSGRLQQTDGRQSASTGIYQCTLEPENNDDDFNSGDESSELCHVAAKLGDGKNFVRTMHQTELVLRNTQFDLSSLRSASNENNENSNANAEKKNYLYANTHAKYGADQESDWEIIRAELPQKGDLNSDALNQDGTLRFESVFRTVEGIDWNECDFDCCVKNDKINQKWDEGANYEYRHAYWQTIARSFVVDEHTGDVFISWEGFYKDCGKIYGASKTLQWTIGVSRLKMEDPSCTFLETTDETYLTDSHFPKCTEPVSIVYQSSRGREVALPYGGFAVIPVASTGRSTGNDKRSFLLSVLSSSGIGIGELTSRVWAFPEGGNYLKDGSKRQDLTGSGTVIDEIFMNQNVWDGGSLRLHYSPATGKPDYLCRTIFEEGIECLPISVTIQDGIPVVESMGKAESFLSKEQTAIFCRLGDADRTKRKDWGRKTTLVTGLDFQWNKVSEQPERIFFGCWGGEGGNGDFGSVEKNGDNLKRVMNGAFADAVLFLPRELEGTIDPREVEAVEIPTAATASIVPNDKIPFSKSLAIVLTLVAVAYLTIYRRKRLLRAWFSTSNASQKESRFGTPYVELQNLDSPSEMMPSLYSSPYSSPYTSPSSLSPLPLSQTEEGIDFVL